MYELEASNAGCCVCGRFFCCVMYADDILLLSASVSGLQYMLNICYKYGILYDILCNNIKSVCVKIGPCWNKPVALITLGNTDLCWTSSLTCLSILALTSSQDSLKVDISCIKRSFYKPCNGILSYSKTNDEFVRLGLVKAYCLQLLIRTALALLIYLMLRD